MEGLRKLLRNMISIKQLKLDSQLDIFNTAADVATEAMQHILSIAQDAITNRGVFKLVLAGGTTPLATYKLLAQTDAEWDKWHIYYGDERCLPVNDSDRNSQAIEQAWLNLISIPEENIHTIPAEVGAETAAVLYESRISDSLPFDLIILGMGEDGHTASLFPGHLHPDERLVVPVYNAPKPPEDRVSLSYSALASTRNLLMLITGEGKSEAMEKWMKNQPLPINQINTRSIKVLLDKTAMPKSINQETR